MTTPEAAAVGELLARHPLSTWLLGSLIAALLAALALPLGATVAQRWRDCRRPATAAVWATLAVAAVVGAATAILLWLHRDIQSAGPWAALDHALAQGLVTHASASVLKAFSLVTHLGDPLALTVLTVGVTVALWAARQRHLALGWLLALAANGTLTRVLKAAFERARPEHLHGFAQAQGYSFPSGHTSASLVAYTLLVCLALRLLARPWHLPLALLAGAVVFTTGWSRVVLHVHYASDVLGGWALGGACAVCTVVVWSAWERHTAVQAEPAEPAVKPAR